MRNSTNILTMKKNLLLALFAFNIASAQNMVTYQGEKINELSFNKIKTGLWKLYDHERGIIISGTMEDDKFVSDIEYSQYGKVVATQKGKDVVIYKNENKIIGTIQYGDGMKIVDANGQEIDAEAQKNYFKVAQVLPKYYGGPVAMRASLMSNIDKSKVKGNKGKVNIKFVIDDDGMVTDAKVVSSTNDQLNEEALRIVQKLSRFQPGIQHGKFVRVEFAIPINF